MHTPIQIAVLGYGHIGRRHAALVLQHPHLELTAVIETDADKRAEAARTGAAVYNSLQTFLEAPTTANLVAVCTPNGHHYEQSRAVLEHGMHVIIEKPLTLTAAQAAELSAIADEQNLHIFPVMQNRFSPPSQWLKELLDSGRLGKIYMVQVSCYWNRDERYYAGNSWRGTKDLDGGTLYTQFSHFLDILLWLFGDLTNLVTKLETFNHSHLTETEDSGIITFDIASGGIGSFSFSTSVWQENLESSLTIIAENGSVKVGGQYMDQVEKCHIRDYELPELATTNACNDYGTYKGSAQNHHHHYENIVQVLQGTAAPEVAAADGQRLIELIEAVYDSHRLYKVSE